MTFDEDRSRVRKEYGTEIFAILRHIALNLLKQEKFLSEASEANDFLRDRMKINCARSWVGLFRCVCPETLVVEKR